MTQHTYKFSVLMTLAATFGLLLLVFICYVDKQQRTEVALEMSDCVKKAEALLDNELANRTVTMQAVLELIAYERNLQEAFLSKDRERLYAIASPVLESLRTRHSVTHFYFTDVHRVNVLRVHQPNRRGDRIDRHTMIEAERTSKTSSGLELGPMGTLTLRSVHPWRREGRLIGYIELGQEIGPAVQTVGKILDVPLFATIKKKYVSQADWSKGMKMLSRKTDWGLLDSSVLITERDESGRIDSNTVARSVRENDSGPIRINDRFYGKGEIPLHDVNDLHVGTIQLFHDLTPGVTHSRVAIIVATVAGLIIESCVMVFFYVMLSRIDRQLRQSTDQLMKAKSAADAANKAKSEFLANMSHEIRTPMTAILGYTELLGENVSEPENVEAVSTIIQNGNYLLEVINDILDLSKIESGKLEVESLRCCPVEIISGVTSLMQVRAAEKGLSLKCEFDGAIPETIHTDPLRLRQILINLVSNAIKFSEQGEVRVVTRLLRREPNQTILQTDVADSGIGLTEKQLTSLFVPFHQADSSTTRKFGGTGLGLSISKRLVEMLGGNIAVTSKHGEGSTFSLSVDTGPLEGIALVEPSSDVRMLKPDLEVDTKQNALVDRLDCRVLLAEDTVTNQLLVTLILAKVGASTTIAVNGQIAVELAEEANDSGQPFDVILMDMQMPVLDGFDATRRLRENGYTGPIIAFTAHAMSGDRKKCLDAGCDDHLTKPIDTKHLFALIREHTHRFRSTFAGSARNRSSAEGVTAAVTEIDGPSPLKDPQRCNYCFLEIDAALQRLQGDHALLIEQTQLFLEFCPELLAKVQRAVASGDPDVVCIAAHSLKGVVADFTSKAPFETAQLLEEQASNGDLSQSKRLLERLQEDVSSLIDELRTYAGGEILGYSE